MTRYGQRTRVGTALSSWISNVVTLTNPFTTGATVVIGNYFYQLADTSTTFSLTNNATATVEFLSVGAGGSGKTNGEAYYGGGAGGEIDIWTSETLVAGTYSYTVTIGASAQATNGGTTSVVRGASTITSSLGGGRGAQSTAGTTGGSGGGGSDSPGTAGGGASGSNTFAGGTGSSNAPFYAGGGGGGATAVGTNAVTNASAAQAGNGGEGYLLTTIDANLTAANFGSLTGMTNISSGGGGSAQHNGGTSFNNGGLGGTGGGDGARTNAGTVSKSPSAGTSYGSGGGAGYQTVTGSVVGKGGLVIIRVSQA